MLFQFSSPYTCIPILWHFGEVSLTKWYSVMGQPFISLNLHSQAVNCWHNLLNGMELFSLFYFTMCCLWNDVFRENWTYFNWFTFSPCLTSSYYQISIILIFSIPGFRLTSSSSLVLTCLVLSRTLHATSPRHHILHRPQKHLTLQPQISLTLQELTFKIFTNQRKTHFSSLMHCRLNVSSWERGNLWCV